MINPSYFSSLSMTVSTNYGMGSSILMVPDINQFEYESSGLKTTSEKETFWIFIRRYPESFLSVCLGIVLLLPICINNLKNGKASL